MGSIAHKATFLAPAKAWLGALAMVRARQRQKITAAACRA
jgi:hypothetical protein